jgi:hypothetical protein
MTQEVLKLAFEGVEIHSPNSPEYIVCAALIEALREHAMREVQRLGQEIEQEPFFTEANGFPQEFVSKDRQKQAIISMTEQCAALVWERDELQKQVWLYEKNGVTCQTYRHKVEQSCSECNVQMNYTTPPQRTFVGLTDEDKAILDAVHRELDRDCDEGNAPGHSHRTKGVWDEDNGKLAGKPCAWCLTWAKFTTLIKNEAAHGIKENT